MNKIKLDVGNAISFTEYICSLCKPCNESYCCYGNGDSGGLCAQATNTAKWIIDNQCPICKNFTSDKDCIKFNGEIKAEYEPTYKTKLAGKCKLFNVEVLRCVMCNATYNAFILDDGSISCMCKECYNIYCTTHLAVTGEEKSQVK